MKKIKYKIIAFFISFIKADDLKEILKQLAIDRYTIKAHYITKIKKGKCRCFLEVIDHQGKSTFTRHSRHGSTKV